MKFRLLAKSKSDERQGISIKWTLHLQLLVARFVLLEKFDEVFKLEIQRH
jgi:hypothetical protein